MTKSFKHIIFTFAIGCLIFVIGNLIRGGFHFESANDFLIDFVFYQLYSFVLGYTNMAFFYYMERRSWKKGDTIKRVLFGIVGSTIITLICLKTLFAIRIVYLIRDAN